MQLIFFSPSLKMCCVILLDILFCLTIFLITVLVSSTEELHERAATPKTCWRHLTLLLSSHQQSGTFLKSRQKTFLQLWNQRLESPSWTPVQISSQEGTLKRQKHP